MTWKSSNILSKGVTKTIKNETKEQKEGFLEMLLGTLGASLLGNMWTGKRMLRAGYGSSIKNVFDSTPSSNKLWNNRNIIRMNIDSMDFTLDIICLKE